MTPSAPDGQPDPDAAPISLDPRRLRLPAMLFRRLTSADGAHTLDELVAEGPLMLLVSTVMAVPAAERERYAIRSVFGMLNAAAIASLSRGWWGGGGGRALPGRATRDAAPPAVSPPPAARPSDLR